MTVENFEYRTSPLFLRNSFEGEGAFKIPIIPKAEFRDEEFDDLLLIGFDKAKATDNNNIDRMVHFFLYDYRFEGIWKNPNKYIERLENYRAVLSPDFSMYTEMNPTMQLYNTFRNRWCGAYLASKGIRVVPTVSWGDASTYDFCFLGIPKGSVVAVSTYMVSEHGNYQDQKEFFMQGYNEMLRRIKPEKIICYNTPFPEMKGDIVFVDYDKSSWRYMNREVEYSKYVDYVCGVLPIPENCDIIIKKGYVLNECFDKGMGSAFGGKWQPKKEEDKRLIGEPNTMAEFTTAQHKTVVKYGDDGYAILERHYTDHGFPKYHTNPHDHLISWKDNRPDFYKQINYPNGCENLKEFRKDYVMTQKFLDLTGDFKDTAEFKWVLDCGAEVVFEWNGKKYFVGRPSTDSKFWLAEAYVETPSIMMELSLDEVLEFELDGTKIKDLITEAEIIERTL